MLGNGSETYFEMPGSDGNLGRLSAYRTADMKPLWSFQQRAPFLTGVVSSAGDVAFVGDFDRVFRAIDVRTGTTLWKPVWAPRCRAIPSASWWTASSILPSQLRWAAAVRSCSPAPC